MRRHKTDLVFLLPLLGGLTTIHGSGCSAVSTNGAQDLGQHVGGDPAFSSNDDGAAGDTGVPAPDARRPDGASDIAVRTDVAMGMDTSVVSASIARIVAAVGGTDKLLKLFRIKELMNAGTQLALPASAQRRDSVLEPPGYWWVNAKDRTDEPAKFDVWAWTLAPLVDPRSKVEMVPDVIEGTRAAFGLRISKTIEPPLELYFDRADNRLVRFDWRDDIYRVSAWKEHDGVRYPSKTVMYRKATGAPWFFHEILELQRLAALPAGLSR